MFQNEARPKAIFTMWLTLHEKLLTLDRLIKWGIDDSPNCSLCATQLENRDHLSVECEYTRMVWRSILKWMHKDECPATTWSQMVDWGVANGKGKSQIAWAFK